MLSGRVGRNPKRKDGPQTGAALPDTEKKVGVGLHLAYLDEELVDLGTEAFGLR